MNELNTPYAEPPNNTPKKPKKKATFETFLKWLTIIGGGLAILGLLVCLIFSRQIKDAFWSGEGIGIVAPFHDDINFDTAHDAVTGDLAESFDAAQVQSLNFEVGSARLTIADGDTNNITVDVQSTKYTKSQIYLQDGVLTVRSSENRYTIGIGVGESSGRVVVHLPKEKAFDTVKLDIGMGGCSVSTLNTARAELHAGMAELHVAAVTVETLLVDVGMGEVDLSSFTAQTATLNVGMGQMKATGSAAKLTADVGMGEMTLDLAEREYETHMHGSCGLGTLRVGGRKIDGAGEFDMNAGAANDHKYTVGMGELTARYDGAAYSEQ